MAASFASMVVSACPRLVTKPTTVLDRLSFWISKRAMFTAAAARSPCSAESCVEMQFLKTGSGIENGHAAWAEVDSRVQAMLARPRWRVRTETSGRGEKGVRRPLLVAEKLHYTARSEAAIQTQPPSPTQPRSPPCQ
jgi:hypothetical protein